jgi:hypothetical protein
MHRPDSHHWFLRTVNRCNSRCCGNHAKNTSPYFSADHGASDGSTVCHATRQERRSELDPFLFCFMGLLLSACQLAFVIMRRRFTNITYKAAVFIAILVVFLLFWINAAVGIIGNENNPANLMYFTVILVGMIGAWFFRLRPRGMAITMVACSLTMLGVGLFGWQLSIGVDRSALLRDIFILSGFFCTLMLIAAGLFLAADE